MLSCIIIHFCLHTQQCGNGRSGLACKPGATQASVPCVNPVAQKPPSVPACAAVQKVWEASTRHASGGSADTGAITRLHSALMAVITHLIGRLRHAAMANEQVCECVRGGGGTRARGGGRTGGCVVWCLWVYLIKHLVALLLDKEC